MGILHFEDTIRQITEGCVLEEQERKKEREQHQQQLLDEKTAAGNDTQQPDDNKSQSLPTDQFTAAEASLSHLTPASSTPTTGMVADPTKRRILYAGIAPGSTQLPSSINAVTGVRPNFISEDAARAVAVAEDEQKQMERLEENAARVALGATASVKPAAEAAARTAAPTTKITTLCKKNYYY